MSIAFTRKHAKHENIQSLPFSYDMEMATDSYSTTILWKAYSIFLYNSWNNFSWSPFHLLFFHLYFQNLPYLCNENRSHSGMSVIVTRNMNLTHEYDNWQSLFYCYTVEPDSWIWQLTKFVLLLYSWRLGFIRENDGQHLQEKHQVRFNPTPSVNVRSFCKYLTVSL